MKHRTAFLISIWIVLFLSVLFLFLITPITSVQANPIVRYVATSGIDTSNDCAATSNPCATIQHAVDVAQPGDEIRVAKGTYTGVSSRPRNDIFATGTVTQVVYISKTVTLRGGYSTSNWTTSKPGTQPTTLDAQGKGRGIYVTGNISVVIDGLRVTNGNDLWQGGDPFLPYGDEDAGGGIYSINTTLTLSNSQVFSNTGGAGGGVFLMNSIALLNNNQVFSNLTNYTGAGLFAVGSEVTLLNNSITANNHGGLYFTFSSVTLTGNIISGSSGNWEGGGLSLDESNTVAMSNTITGNSALVGGGIYQFMGNGVFNGNTITNNSASDQGGGLTVFWSSATFTNNLISNNTASIGGGGYLWGGGDGGNFILRGNVFQNNIAAGSGGGLSLEGSDPMIATIDSNSISNNSADTGAGVSLNGGNIVFSGNTLNNNLASGSGGGLLISSGSNTILTNTITSNTAFLDGGGVYMDYGNAVINGNTINNNLSRRWAGGLAIRGNASLSGNIISGNIAVAPGGVWLAGNDICFNNSVVGNTATAIADSYGGSYGGGGLLVTGFSYIVSNTISHNSIQYGYGGGVSLDGTPGSILTGNIIMANTALRGGGLHLDNNSNATFYGNTIKANTAQDGAGSYLIFSYGTFINTLIADNQGTGNGSAVYASSSSLHLAHTTIAHNAGSNAIYADINSDRGGPTIFSSLSLINTILVSHTVGIAATAGNTVTLNATVWANGVDWAGSGTVVTGTINYHADPLFVDPVHGNYHLSAGSPAIDAGVNVNVYTDLDGDFRPQGCGYDIGADEFNGGLPVMNLRVIQAITDTNTLTATLIWNVSPNAVTSTLRTSTSFIDDTNWLSATLLTDSLPGSTSIYTATIPYSSGTIYFGLKSHYTCGSDSSLLQIFWPHLDSYLPIITH